MRFAPKQSWTVRYLTVAWSVWSLSCGGVDLGGGPVSGKDPISSQVFHAVNSYRSQNGKKPLTRHSGLDRMAMAHSQHLMNHAGKFGLHGKKVSHEGFESRVLIARRVHGMDSVSENVAAGILAPATAGQGLLSMWKRSSGHHKNLLDDWTLTGIGSVRGSDGTIFSTQLFATKAIGHTQLRDRINQEF